MNTKKIIIGFIILLLLAAMTAGIVVWKKKGSGSAKGSLLGGQGAQNPNAGGDTKPVNRPSGEYSDKLWMLLEHYGMTYKFDEYWQQWLSTDNYRNPATNQGRVGFDGGWVPGVASSFLLYISAGLSKETNIGVPSWVNQTVVK